MEAERLTRVYAGYGTDPRRAAAWSAGNAGNQAVRAEVERELVAAAGDAVTGVRPVLDAGCGTGYWLQRLVALGVRSPRLYGVDLIEKRVEAARRRVPQAQVQAADVRELPFAADTFDLVLLFTVLSSQSSDEDRGRTLREARRVIAPGGVVAVWDLRRTRRAVGAPLLRRHLGPEVELEAVTLLPPLARRLGRRTALAYPLLSRVPLLRTHWLAVWRAPRNSESRTSSG